MSSPVLNQVYGSNITDIRKRTSNEAQEMERSLQKEKKVLACLYEEELIGERKVNFHTKQ